MQTPKVKAPGSQPSSDEGSRSRNKDAHDPYSSVAGSSGLKSIGATPSGSGTVPQKRKSNGLQARSSAGDVFLDDDAVDKKPRIGGPAAGAAAAKPKPGVLADRKNAAPAAGPAPLQPEEQAELAKIKREIEHCEAALSTLRYHPEASRGTVWYDKFDEIQRELIPLRTKLRMYDGRPGGGSPAKAANSTEALANADAARKQALAAAAAALQGELVNGGYTCAADAPQEVRQEFLRRPQVAAALFSTWVKATPGAVAGPSGARAAGDAIGAAMNALSGLNAGRLGGDVGNDSDEERMWGQLAPVTGVADFDTFVKAALEGEGFEGNVNVQKACEAIGLANMSAKVPHMTCTLLPHQVRGLALSSLSLSLVLNARQPH